MIRLRETLRTSRTFPTVWTREKGKGKSLVRKVAWDNSFVRWNNRFKLTKKINVVRIREIRRFKWVKFPWCTIWKKIYVECTMNKINTISIVIDNSFNQVFEKCLHFIFTICTTTSKTPCINIITLNEIAKAERIEILPALFFLSCEDSSHFRNKLLSKSSCIEYFKSRGPR